MKLVHIRSLEVLLERYMGLYIHTRGATSKGNRPS